MKKLVHLYFILCIIFLLVVPISMHFQPELVSKFLGFRFYVVLTNSMEPTIPTYSLVFTRIIDEEKVIKPNTIVTFNANRDGEDVLITHYYRDTVEHDGVTYYRTQPEGIKDQYDSYKTTRQDIIGEYVFHIPYIGRTFLFLQSQFGFLLYAQWGIIFLINKVIKSVWKEKEDKQMINQLEEIDFEDSQIYYYTRTNVSRTIAEELAQGTHIHYIQDHVDWHGSIGYMKAGYYAMRKKKVEIMYGKPTKNVIYLCFPLWAGTFPPAVRTFIDKVGRDRIVAIVSSKGSTLKDRDGFINVYDVVGKQSKDAIVKYFNQKK